jgi:hypothetical protein
VNHSDIGIGVTGDNIGMIGSIRIHLRHESLSGEGICVEKGELVLDFRTGAGIISLDGD